MYGIALPGYWLDVGTPESYLQAHRDVLERIVPDRGRRRARQRLHARRPDRGGRRRRAARAARVRRAGRGASRRARASAASPSSARARGSAPARSSRTRSSARGATVGEAPPSIGSIVGDDAELGAGCEVREPRGRRPGRDARRRRTMLDHGLRIGAGQRDPRRRRCASRERRDRTASSRAGSRSRGAGSSSGPRPSTTSASCSSSAPGESLSLQYHELKDESWLVREGRATLELGGGRRDELETIEIGAGDALPLPARHRAPRDRARGHARRRGLDAASRRRRPARGPLRPRGHLGAL